MPGESRDDPMPPDLTASEPAGPGSVDGEQGFSTAEKIIGVGAAYKHPLASSAVASAMLRTESDPVRRDQLSTLRQGALTWWAVSAGVGVIVFIAVLIAVTHSSGAGSSCTGGLDKFDPLDTTYQSTDNQHWTVTYPCNGGGSKTVPIARRKVPGIGG